MAETTNPEIDFRLLAQQITLVENELPGYKHLLQSLRFEKHCIVAGITGPPGAGKSSLINALLKKLAVDKKIAVIAVDPTSPFTHGALLGDRLRMSEYFLSKNVFIRSFASRGALGGLAAKSFEVTDVVRAAGFDYVFIETVGVGQSEVEIASLADTTVVVYVPESGDEVQMLKSGVVEIADVIVVNKSDRQGADALAKNISAAMHERQSDWTVPVIKTTATNFEGIDELINAIDLHQQNKSDSKKKSLLFNKAFHLIQNKRMKDLNFDKLKIDLDFAMQQPGFNLYGFIETNY